MNGEIISECCGKPSSQCVCDGGENPVIVQLKKALAEARECELTAQGHGYGVSVAKWVGYQDGIRRAIQIVEGK